MRWSKCRTNLPDKMGRNRVQSSLEVRDKKKSGVKKQANSQLAHDEIFFEEVPFTEWYLATI